MAKVGTEMIRARKGSKYHTVNINFYRKGTYFAPSNLPEGFDDWHKSKIKAETYEKAVEIVTELVRDFWEATLVQRKMIAYRLNAWKSRDALPKETNNSKTWQLGRQSDGPSISLEYKIIWEVVMGDKKFFCDREYDPNLKMDITGKNILHNADGYDHRLNKYAPHTDELEAFFKNTTDSMNMLVDRIEDFFNVEPELLSSKIKDVKLLK